MLGKDDVLRLLEEKDIPFLCEEHDSVLNMSESSALTLSLAGVRCKNLLLRDKKGQSFLVVTTAAKALDLIKLAAAMGSKRLSFASADTLFELLGVRAGSLSPLALINDEAGRVRLIIDVELASEQRFLFHPLESNASVSIFRTDLDTFLRDIAHLPDWLTVHARQDG